MDDGGSQEEAKRTLWLTGKAAGMLLLPVAAAFIYGWVDLQIVKSRLNDLEERGSTALIAHVENERGSAEERAKQAGRFEEQLIRLREDVRYIREMLDKRGSR